MEAMAALFKLSIAPLLPVHDPGAGRGVSVAVAPGHCTFWLGLRRQGRRDSIADSDVRTAQARASWCVWCWSRRSRRREVTTPWRRSRRRYRRVTAVMARTAHHGAHGGHGRPRRPRRSRRRLGGWIRGHLTPNRLGLRLVTDARGVRAYKWSGLRPAVDASPHP